VSGLARVKKRGIHPLGLRRELYSGEHRAGDRRSGLDTELALADNCGGPRAAAGECKVAGVIIRSSPGGIISQGLPTWHPGAKGTQNYFL
jgi:hypothetical protein